MADPKNGNVPFCLLLYFPFIIVKSHTNNVHTCPCETWAGESPIFVLGPFLAIELGLGERITFSQLLTTVSIRLERKIKKLQQGEASFLGRR